MSGVADFQRRGSEDWRRLRELQKRVTKHGARSLSMSEVRRYGQLYRQATGDLAYARTHYPRARITRELNRLVALGHTQFHRPRPRRLADVGAFFLDLFPAVARANARYFAASTAIFFGAFLVGWAMTAVREEFAALLVSPQMIEIVQNGETWLEDAFAVMPPSVIAVQIFQNNIFVTVLTFAFGITFGIGTVYILAMNGMMLGTLGYLTVAYNTGDIFWKFVSIHGMLELSIIFLAGAAGLMIGHGIAAPGRMSRGAALRTRGREAGVLVLVGMPLLVLAGIIESYISPPGVDYMPWGLKLLCGALAAGLFYVMAFGIGRTEAAANALAQFRGRAPSAGPTGEREQR